MVWVVVPMLRIDVAPSTVMPAVAPPRVPKPETVKVPALTMVVPVKVLAPPSVRVPVPILLRLRAPEMAVL